MKQVVFLILGLIIPICMGASVQSLNTVKAQAIEKFIAQKTWGSIIVSIAELHLAQKGPLDDLIVAINAAIEDLSQKLVKLDEDWALRTGEHNNEVKRLNREITNAQVDIANTNTFLSEVLYVQKNNLEHEIKFLNSEIERTNKYIDEQKLLREAARKDYELRVTDHNSAIEAIDECLGLVGQLITGSSLAEIKKTKTSLISLQNKLSKSTVEGSLVKALVTITTQTDFSDQKALNQVAQLLHSVREAVEASLEKLNKEEEEAVANHQKDLKDRTADINKFSFEITEKTKLLNTTNESIFQNEQFVASRTQDLTSFQASLDFENASYERAEKEYEAMVEQFNKELGACQEALELLQSGDFSNYIGDRMASDRFAADGKIHDQARGGKTTVN